MIKRKTFFIFAVCGSFGAHSFANPISGVVANGAATIASSGNLLTINQTSDRSVINWGSFNIGQGETTLFQFTGAAGANSAVLNRIAAGNPSIISGMLRSTVGVGGPIGGTVFILNPSGVLFTSTAQITVGSFVTTTLEVNNNQFLNNANLSLSGSSTAGIRNQGSLSALGDVFLIANTVQNSGNITAGGTVGLAAGTQVTLAQAGMERLTVEAGTPGTGATTGVDNTASGQINAVVAELKAAGGNIYALAINNSGAIRANSISHEGGHIYLRASGGNIQNSGSLSADNANGAGGTVVVDGGHNAASPSTVVSSGSITATGSTTGGQVELLGDEVAVGSGGVVDVSGNTGGGSALIGGDFHGANPAIQNAQVTYISPTAVIKADAGTSGNGGNVAVWSDNSTLFAGSISAKGGVLGGDGGYVEVSGKQQLGFSGTVDLSAAHGKSGTLLLDPGTFSVEAANPDIAGDGSDDDITALTDLDNASKFPGANSIITAGAVNGLLTGNNNLILAATTSGTVDAAITGSGNASLQLSAPTLTLNAGITLAGTGTLTLNGGAGGTGLLTAATLSLTGAGNVGASGSALNTKVGAISFGKTSGDSFISQDTGTTVDVGGNTGGGSVTLTAGPITLDNNPLVAGAGAVTLNSSSTITIGENITASSVAVHSGTSGVGDTDFGAGVTIQADTQSYQAGKGDGTANTAEVDLVDNTPGFLNTAGTASPASFTYRQDASITTADLPALAQFGVAAPAAYTVQSDGGDLTLSSGSGLNVAGSGLTLSAFGTLTISDNLSLASLSATGNSIQLNATGSLATPTVKTTGDQSFTGPITLGADTTLTATTIELGGVTGAGNSLTLNNSALATLGGAVSGVNQLNATGAGTLTVGSTISASGLTDSEVTTLGGSTVTTTAGDQNYTGAVTLGADATLNSATVELAGVTGAGYSLTLNNTALATLNGAVSGVNQLNATGSGTLTVGSTIAASGLTDSEVTALNGGTVTTTAGDQNYTGAVTLGADATLNSATVELAGVTGAGYSLTLNNTALATLNGAVSGVNQLNATGGGTLTVGSTIVASDLTDSEVTALNGGTVTTTAGDQNYTGAVTLGADTTLNSATIELAGVTGAGNSLTLNNTALATLGGAVSGVNQLNATGSGTLAVDSTISANGLTDSEGTALIGSTVTTTGGDQNYTGSVALDAETTLNSGTIELAGVTTIHSLTLNNTGLATLNGAVSGINQLNATGTGTLTVKNTISAADVVDHEATTLGGGTVTTTGGNQNYTGTVTLTVDTTLNSGTMQLAGVTGGGNSLTLNNTGLASLGGAMSGVNQLNATGSGTLTVGSTISASGLTDSEVTGLYGGTVTTTGGDQNYTGAVTLGADTTLNSATIELAGVTGASYSLTLNNTALATLNGAVSGINQLNATGSGTLTVGSTISASDLTDSEVTALNGGTVTTTAGDQNYIAAVTLGADTTLNSATIELAGVTGAGNSLTLNNTALATLNGAVSGVNQLNTTGSGTLTAGSTIAASGLTDSEVTTLSGSTVTTTGGDQNYTGAVTLGADTTLNSATVELAGVTGAGYSLTLNNTALATLNGAVSGVNQLNATGSGTLTAGSTISANDLTDSEVTTLSGSTVTTTGGDQNYTGAVTLGADTTLNSATIELAGVTGAGNSLTLNNTASATLNGAVNGLNQLNATGTGTLAVKSTVSAADLTDNEGTTLGGTVTTTGGDQDYTAAVTLGADTTLNSATIELGGVTGAGNSLTLNNTALATLNGAVSGVNQLNATGSGTLTVDSTISASGLTDNEVTALNGGTVTTTSGDQNYTGAVTLGAATTLNSATIELAGVTGAGNSLTLNNTALASLNGAVSGVDQLNATGAGTLTVKSTVSAADLTDNEGTTLSGTVTTTGGDQDYTAAVTLGADSTLNSATIELAGVTGAGSSLTLNNTALATLNGAVSGVNQLNATGNGTLTVGSTIAASGLTDSEVTTLGGSTVTTTAGDQNYTGAVTLGADTTLNSGTIELAGVTGASYSLTLNNTALATLNGAVSGVNQLNATGSGTLTVGSTISASGLTDSEVTALNGGTVTTTAGDQNYTGAVTLGAATTLNSATVELAGVTGGGNSLTLNNTALATLNSAVSGVNQLNATGSGTLTVGSTIAASGLADSEVTALNGGTVTTTAGDQNYTAAVTLGADTTLNSGTIELAGLTAASHNLTLNNSALASLNGPATGLGQLNATGSGTLAVNTPLTLAGVTDSEGTTLSGSTVTTTGGDQNYTGPVTLGADTTLSSATIELAGVTGASYSLTLNNTALATLNGAVSGVDQLNATGAGTLAVKSTVSAADLTDNEGTTLSGTVTTTGGDQDYTAAVTLGADSTLNSATIELTGVTGAGNSLTLNNTALATLNGAVSGVNQLNATGAGTLAVKSTISADDVTDSEVTALNGGRVTTTAGDQNYTGAVTLGAATTLNSATIELAGVTGGGNSLTLNNTALATLNGAVSGVNQLNATGSGTLTVKSTISASALADNEVTDLNGGTVTTTGGDQDFTAAVTLSADTTLNSATIELAGVTGAGNSLTLNNTALATLNGAVSGVNQLNATGSGTLTANNTISANNFTDSEVTTLSGGSVTTTGGDQDYSATVTLTANTTLNAATIELGAVNGGNKNLTLNNSGLATLNGTVSGIDQLNALSSGTLTVNGTISANDLTDNEVTTLKGGTVTATGGDQNYGKTVTLGADTTLNSATIELAGVTGGGNSLTLNNTALATLNGAVSGVNQLNATGTGTLTVKSTIAANGLTDSEVTALNGGTVTTTAGDQNYTGAVTLGADTTLNSGTIELAGVTGAGKSLTLNNTALATLNGAVGGVNQLNANGGGTLTVGSTISANGLTDSEVTALNGSTVTTTAGDQNYTGAVTLGADTTLNSGTIELAGVTGAGKSLTLNNTALATLNGAVGGVNQLNANGGGTLMVKSTIGASGLTDSEGTALNGGTVTTTGGDQNYTGAVTLGADTTLNSATIELASVTGAGKSLTLNNTALATLNGAVSGVNQLNATGAGTLTVGSTIAASGLTDSEVTTLGGGTVTTTGGDQDYTGAVTLGADTTLNSGTIELAGVTGASYSLTLNNTALATLNGAVSGVNQLNATGSGTLTVGSTIAASGLTDSEVTDLNGGTVTTTGGDQDFTAAVTLSADTTLNSATIELAGVTGAGNSLTLNNTALASLNGAVSGVNQLNATGSGTLAVNNTIGAIGFTDSEGTTLGGTITTTGGDQDYTASVTLDADTTLNSGTIELASVTGAGNSLTLNNTALATLNGAVSGVNQLNATGAGTLTVKSTISANDVTDSEVTALNGGTVTTTGGDQDYTGAVTLGADTTLNSATVELAGVTGAGYSLTLNNTALATLNGAVNGVNQLNATGGGTLTVGSTIAASGLTDNEVTDLNGATVTTTGGDQNFTAAVTLSADTTLNSATIELASVTGAGKSLTLNNTALATLNGAVSGVNQLNATGSGTLTVGSTIAGSDLTDSEVTALNGGTVTTTAGDQNYTGAVTLGVDTTLNSATIELAGVTGASYSLTLNNTALATLNGAVSGVNQLNATGSGTLTVGSTIAASGLTDSEVTTLGGGTVTTTAGDQNYTGAVTLGADTTLNSATIELAGVTGASYSLTLNNTALASLNGAVSGVNQLNATGAGTLAVKSTISANDVTDSEVTALNGGTVTTTGGDQDYTGAVTLGADTTLNSATIELAGVTGAGYSLTLKNTALATLNGAVSGVNQLNATGSGTLTVGSTISANGLTDSEVTALNGGTVTTTAGDQNYTGAVTLGADTTLNSATIELAGVTGASYSLTLNNTALATLNGAVSGVNQLNATGTGTLGVKSTISADDVTDSEVTTLSGGTVTTTAGDQNYTGAVTLGADTTLNSATIELAGVTGAGKSLTLNNTALATLNGAVSGVNQLNATGTGTLTVKSTIAASGLTDSEVTALNGGTVTTTAGDQNYTGAVTLGADTTLNSATVELAGVTGAGYSLTLNNTALATLNGAVSGVNQLNATGTGTLTVDSTIAANGLADSEVTTLNGGTVTTTAGDQNYTGAVTLGADTTLNSATVELAGVTGAGYSLTLNNTALATLNGAVNGVNQLNATGSGTLTVGSTIAASGLTDNEVTDLNGGTVTTTGGDQNFTAAVTLSADTTLNSATIELASVTGAGKSLTLNNTALATLNGSVSGVNQLNATGSGTLTVGSTIAASGLTDSEVTALNGGTVTTTGGDENYTGAVTLGADTTLNSATVELAGVTGASYSLTLNNTALATLNGTVSGVNQLNATGSGTLTVENTIAASGLTDNEVTDLNGGTVTTKYGDQNFTAAVTLSADTTLNSATVELAGVTGAGYSLTLNNTALATLNGAVSGVNQLNATGGGTLTVGSTIAASGLTDSEVTALNGGTVTTTGGDQNYSAAVTLGADTTLNSATVELAGVTGAGYSLTLNNTALATLNGAVSGVNQLNATGAGTLTVGSTISASGLTDSEVTTLGGSTVTTTAGDQNYTGAVTLGADTTLNSATVELAGVTGAGYSLTLNNTALATLNGAVSGVNQLNATGSGTLAVESTISANGLTDSEVTTLSGGTVTTTAGDQNYTGAVTLGADTTLNSATIELASVTGAGNSLTLNNTALATLNGAVSGVNQLNATGSGTLTVGSTIAANGLTDSEVTTLNGGTVTTTGGDQNYTAAVTLGADTTLNSATIELASVTGADNSLTLNNTALATLNGAVSGVNQLNATGSGTLAVDNTIAATGLTDSENTTLSGGTVTTSGDGQIYNNPLTLGANTTVSDLSGGKITFKQTVDATTAGGQSLTAITDGTTEFDAAVGGIHALKSLDVKGFTAPGNGHTELDAGVVTTEAGGQTYENPVILSVNDTLTDTGSGNINFNSTIDGAFTLVANTKGNEIFKGVVGGTTPLVSLMTDANITPGGNAVFEMTAPGGVNPAGVNAGSVITYDPVIFDEVNGGTIDHPSVQTTGIQDYKAGGILEADTDVVAGSFGNLGITGNGFEFRIGAVIVSDLAEEDDRRGLATITPKAKKREARHAKVEPGDRPQPPPGINLGSSQVP